MSPIIFIVIVVLAIIIIKIVLWKRGEVEAKDKAYACLCGIGLDARMAEKGRPEEHIARPKGGIGAYLLSCLSGSTWGGKSLGLIEIQGSPIRWVNMVKGITGDAGGRAFYGNALLIPDSTIRKEGYLELESVRVKSVPVVGQVVDFRWQARLTIMDESQQQTLIGRKEDLVKRLGQDALLNQTLIRLKEDIKMRSYPEYGYWVILIELTPSREQWDCYETIARHLLEGS